MSAHIITWASNSLSPEAVLQFANSHYSSIESEKVISPLVQLLTNIATDLTVAAIPVNYTVLNDSQSHILGALPDVPDYNRNRPINARSKFMHINVRRKCTDFFPQVFPLRIVTSAVPQFISHSQLEMQLFGELILE